MKKIDKKEVTKSLIILGVFLLYLAGIIGFYVYDANQLKKEAMCTKGVIIGKFSGTQGQSNVRYEFNVDNVKYVSSCGYSFKYDIVDIGDTCFVIYARENPKNNKLTEIMYKGKSILKLQKLNSSIKDSNYKTPN